MSAFELTVKEAATLINVLESCLSDLSTERVKTDNKAWHAELKEREALLGGILNRLKSVS